MPRSPAHQEPTGLGKVLIDAVSTLLIHLAQRGLAQAVAIIGIAFRRHTGLNRASLHPLTIKGVDYCATRPAKKIESWAAPAPVDIFQPQRAALSKAKVAHRFYIDSGFNSVIQAKH